MSYKNTWLDTATTIRAGESVDLTRLIPYIKKQIPDTEGEVELLQFHGGYSNLTYLLSIGDSEYVLRRQPIGANVKSGHDMGREYKVMKALHTTGIKVPLPYLYCEDANIMGSPFYLMERIKGVILRPKMPEKMLPDAKTMAGIADSLVESFVQLHKVDYQQCGLSDLGNPVNYVDRQIQGWAKRYFKAKTDELKELEAVSKWLAEHIPPSDASALIHNDFKYDNLVLAEKDWTQVLAILDWEMATLGDPLMDLGTSLGYWVNDDDPDWMKQIALSPTTLDGNPSRSQLVEMYSKASGKDLGDVVFYYVYGLFKVAVIAQQIYYRYVQGHTKDRRFASLNQAIKGLGIMANQAIIKNRIDTLF